jgi:hypothetical protein
MGRNSLRREFRELRGLDSAWVQLGVLLGAFALGTLAAKAFGTDLGTAATFGQIAFAAALVAMLLRVA